MHYQRERFLIRYSRDFAPFTVARASGSWLETTDGQRVLDFTSGQICSTIGHNHPRIVAAVQQSLNKVVLVNTGGEANEVALRLAKMHTGRFEIVGLTRSWHGLQAGAASLNLAGGHAGYGPMMPGTLAL